MDEKRIEALETRVEKLERRLRKEIIPFGNVHLQTAMVNLIKASPDRKGLCKELIMEEFDIFWAILIDEMPDDIDKNDKKALLATMKDLCVGAFPEIYCNA